MLARAVGKRGVAPEFLEHSAHRLELAKKLGATAVSLAALPLTRRLTPPVWIGWAIPLLVMVIFVYLLRSFFLR